MKGTRAFTLMEALVSISLFAMVMFLMANLMVAAANSERFLGEKDRIQEVALSCLNRMAHEVRGANRWIDPLPGGSSHRLVFETPDWELEPQEFPAPPAPFPTAWAPADSAFQMTVQYSVVAGELTRVLQAESHTWTTPLLRDTVDLVVTHPDPSQVKLTLTVLSQGRPLALVTQVLSPQQSWLAR